MSGLKELYEEKYEFLGFSHTNKNIHTLQNRYKGRFSDDPKMLNLDNWSKLEQDDPVIFGSMYQFFLYKIIIIDRLLARLLGRFEKKMKNNINFIGDYQIQKKKYAKI